MDELEIEIFNTYDEALLDYYLYDLCNESSLVFKIDFEVDSVLFAGDYYSAANSEYLINTYGDRLKLIRPELLKHIWKALVPLFIITTLHPMNLSFSKGFG